MDDLEAMAMAINGLATGARLPEAKALTRCLEMIGPTMTHIGDCDMDIDGRGRIVAWLFRDATRTHGLIVTHTDIRDAPLWLEAVTTARAAETHPHYLKVWTRLRDDEWRHDLEHMH